MPDAQVRLDRILRNGDSAEGRFLLGVRICASGNYPAALKQFASAAEVNAQLPDLQSLYGQALLNTGDPDGAAAAFRRELTRNANHNDGNIGLGQIPVGGS